MRGFKSRLYKCSQNTMELASMMMKEDQVNLFILINYIQDNESTTLVNVCSLDIPCTRKYLIGKSKKYRYINIKKPIIFENSTIIEQSSFFFRDNSKFLGWAYNNHRLNRIDVINNTAIPNSLELIKQALID